jgi:hypothetical protein
LGIIDDIGRMMAPHTAALVQKGDDLESRMCEIEQRISDLARPDVGDIFLRIIRKGKFPVEKIRLGQPKSGEYWMVQMFTTNGIASESPPFTVRTSGGALIIAALARGTGQEPVNGDVAILPGEELWFEPAEEGVFDFTMHLIRRKIPQHHPNAGAGVGQGDDTILAGRGMYESNRYVPDLIPGFSGPDVPEQIIGPNEEQYGGYIQEVVDS